MASFGQMIGEEAFQLFVKPRINDAIKQAVAKDANLSPAEVNQKASEIETAIYDAIEIGLDEYIQSQQPQP